MERGHGFQGWGGASLGQIVPERGIQRGELLTGEGEKGRVRGNFPQFCAPSGF